MGQKVNLKVSNYRFEKIKFRNLIPIFLFYSFGILSNYIFTVLVVKILDIEAWGIFATFLAYFQIASKLTLFGMDTTLLKLISEYLALKKFSEIKEIYKKIIFLSISFSFLTILFFQILKNSFLFQKVNFGGNFFLVLPFYNQLLLNAEFIRAFEDTYLYLIFRQFGIYILSIIIFLILLKAQKSLYIPEISYSLAIIILFFISTIYVFRYLKNLKSCKTLDKSEITYSFILNLSFSLFISSLFVTFNNWIDIIILSTFRTHKEVGIYNIFQKVSCLINLPLNIVNIFIVPKFAKLWAKNRKRELIKLATNVTKFILIISILITLIFLMSYKYILIFFLKNHIDNNYNFFSFFILVFTYLINVAFGNVGYILKITSYQNFYRNVMLLSTLVNVILNIILVPIFGILGASISFFIYTALWNILCSYKIKQIFKYSIIGEVIKIR